MSQKLLTALLFALVMISGAVQAGGDAARGQELSVDCADCHGADGLGDEDSPAIAGLDEAYQIAQLQAFKSGERTDEEGLMLMYTEELSEQDMADLAAYYATLQGN